MEIVKSQYPIFHWDMVQGTDEWKAVRAGKITGSVAKTFLVNGKSENGFGVGAMTEMHRLQEERLTGRPRESFKTKATDWGHEYEPEAVEDYELRYFVKTRAIGFVTKDENNGCSPDRLMPSIKEGLEIKCFPTNHMEIFEKKKYQDGQYVQCQHNLWCTGYEAWNLYYYHPWLPDSCNHIRFRFTPDQELFKKFDERTETLNGMIASRVDAIRGNSY